MFDLVVFVVPYRNSNIVSHQMSRFSESCLPKSRPCILEVLHQVVRLDGWKWLRK